MRSVGFGGSGHDWSCCLAGDGGELIYAEEARLTRRKHGIGCDLLHSAARTACLAEAGVSAAEVDHAVACDLVPLPLAAPFRRRLTRIRHHQAHAWGAFLASPFERAAVLVTDNSGSPRHRRPGEAESEREVETLSTWRGRGDLVEEIDTVYGRHHLEVSAPSDYYRLGDTDDSLGHLYAVASQELGFVFRPRGGGADSDVTEDGKTMGLAAFGDDRYLPLVSDFVALLPEGRLRLRLVDGELRAALRRRLAAAGSPEETFARRAAVAYAVQVCLERAVLHVARHLRRASGERYLAMAGGVALNCVANSRVAREAGFDDVFVLPAAGDDGNALGAALFGLVALGGQRRPPDLYRRLPFLGPSASAGEPARTELHGTVAAGADETLEAAAEALAAGRIVGWFEGRSELGPRALGHRSILADPRPPGMQDRINRLVKRREGFRPFAPLVLERAVDELFDLPAAARASAPFMLMVADVRDEVRRRIPAVVHVDGTARLQVVTRQRYPRLHDLLERFASRTGLPVLLNTSFNLAGDPIVETPQQALDCFQGSDMDLLYLEGALLARAAEAVSA